MTETDVRRQILEALRGLEGGDLRRMSERLFGSLGYWSERSADHDPDPARFVGHPLIGSRNEKAEEDFCAAATAVQIIFQVMDEEIAAPAGRGLRRKDIEPANSRSFLFIAVELAPGDYTRRRYAAFARLINRCVAMPAVVLFRMGAGTGSGTSLTVAFVHRRRHTRVSERDVLGSVSSIRGIDPVAPHRAHVEILRELSFDRQLRWMEEHNASRNFDGLMQAWLETLNTEVQGRRFYRELFRWFEWAIDEVRFPSPPQRPTPVELHLIRLITRLLFIWFIKEKRLVAEEWFIEERVATLLKEWDRDTGDHWYRAILQNLFFATLNTEQGDRRFSRRNQSDHRNPNLYRYEEQIADLPRFRALMDQTPFINGGLFDCLDSFASTSVGGWRLDCFSDNEQHRRELSVPNRLFFGDGGLIPLLGRYKFTVEENTPIDQEVALDPELLGKVFENLLASYNPETQESARKTTGSYYTPRRIVDYMAEEALVAYLARTVPPPHDSNASLWEGHLRNLLDWEVADPQIASEQGAALVRAIADIRVLDPAIGSGAFPMGVLHKLSLALERLDPTNDHWRAIQKRRAMEQTDRAYSAATSHRERDRRLSEISDTFERFSTGFGRKLYLIQNSLFGVDIQPVAIQIAKLRVFISLAIEQRRDETKENLGIRPLPNLETRFVAANTLIGLGEEATPELGDRGIEALEERLREIRERFFGANNRDAKVRCRQEDEAVRRELARELEATLGFRRENAERVSAWDPYDQGAAAADWFDPEWMFGVRDGFDVVIGNPPYVRADSGASHLAHRKRIMDSGAYTTLYEKWDLMVPFVEKGLSIVNPGGSLMYIASNAICTSKYAVRLLDLIQRDYFQRSIDYFEDMAVFEASVVPVVLHIGRTKTARNITSKILRRGSFEHVARRVDMPTERFKAQGRTAFRKEYNPMDFTVTTIKLGDICYMSIGMVVNADEKTAQGAFRKDDLISEEKTDIHSGAYIEGKDIASYVLKRVRFLEWGTDRVPSQLRRPTFPELYSRPKIMRGLVTGGIYDDTGLLCNHSIIVCVRFDDMKGVTNRSIQGSIEKFNDLPRRHLEEISQRFDLRYLLAIINSSFALAYLNNIRRSTLENYFYPDDYRRLPIADISLEQQKPCIDLVDAIHAIAKDDDYLETPAKQERVGAYRKEIDHLVYSLYDLEKARNK